MKHGSQTEALIELLSEVDKGLLEFRHFLLKLSDFMLQGFDAFELS